MNNDVIPIKLKKVLPMEAGHAVFLGNDEKTFVIFVDDPVGMAILINMRGVSRKRPLTHDLMGHFMSAFGIGLQRVVINDVEEGVFFARLILSQENQIQQLKMAEIDARPSDSIVLALAHDAPIFAAKKVWDNTEDVTAGLEELLKKQDKEEDDADEI